MNRPTALFLTMEKRHGLLSAAHALADILENDPHHWQTLSFDWSSLEELKRLDSQEILVKVAMDPAAASIFAQLNQEQDRSGPVVGIISGLKVDPAWTKIGEANSEFHLSVADVLQAEEALAAGLSEDALVPLGIPVCSAFTSVSPEDKQEYRRRCKLPFASTILLVVTDGVENRLQMLCSQLAKIEQHGEPQHIIFDVAKDVETGKLLQPLIDQYSLPAQILGKVEDVGVYWSACDVLLAKPFLYIEQRALTLRLPLLSFEPTSVEEKFVTDLYRQRGIGEAINSTDDLEAKWSTWQRDDFFGQARQRLAQITRRSATNDIARFITQVGRQRKA